MRVSGRALKMSDNIDTDLIIPAKHLRFTDPQYLSQHVFEALGEEFRMKLKGSVIVAGRSFGIGSSREQAAIAVKAAGVVAVVAESFSRIFFRNAINNGLPVLECRDASRLIEDGEELVVDLERGVVEASRTVLQCKPLRGLALEILRSGGLTSYLKRLSENSALTC